MNEAVAKLLSSDGYGPDGERYVSEEDMSHCENCRAVSFDLKPLPGWGDVMACPLCRDEGYQVIVEAILNGEEPECTCSQSDVDLFDARGCELHDDASRWNRIRRSITAVRKHEPAMDKEGGGDKKSWHRAFSDLDLKWLATKRHGFEE